MTRDRSPVSEDRILDLLHGLIPEEEERELIERLAEDPEAESTLKLYARAVERARARGGPRLAGAVEPRRSRLPRWLMRPGFAQLAGVAVAVALVTVAVKLPKSGADVPLLPTDTNPIHLRADGALPENVRRGIDEYARGEWSRAEGALEEDTAGETAEIVRRIYLGSALARQARWGEALVALEPVPRDLLPAPWSDEVRWTWFLALRGDGRTAEADSLLRAWADEPGVTGDRARRELGIE